MGCEKAHATRDKIDLMSLKPTCSLLVVLKSDFEMQVIEMIVKAPYAQVQTRYPVRAASKMTTSWIFNTFSSHLAHSAQLGSAAGPAWPRGSKPEQTYGNRKTEQTNDCFHPLKGHTRRNVTLLFSSA